MPGSRLDITLRLACITHGTNESKLRIARKFTDISEAVLESQETVWFDDSCQRPAAKPSPRPIQLEGKSSSAWPLTISFRAQQEKVSPPARQTFSFFVCDRFLASGSSYSE
jgi:hypothetical protein